MHISRLFLAVGVMLASAPGCTDHGKPILDSTSQVSQSQLNSTQQWQQLAARVSDDMGASIGASKLAANAIVSTPIRPVFVSDERDDVSQFVAEYREMLKTELTRRGYIVFAAYPPADA